MTRIRLSDGCTMSMADAVRLRDELNHAIRQAHAPACTCCGGSGSSGVCSLACGRCGGSGKEPVR